MTPERHEQITILYGQALKLQGSERSAFLERIGAEDQGLRDELQSLLALPAVDAAAGLGVDGFTRREGTLAGHRLKQYEFLSRIGAGGMGEVYRAKDENLGRHVAIKVLSPEFSKDPERLARLRLEARLLATLNHPNIGAIYDVQEEKGLCGLVLELVEGDTLSERIRRGALPADEAVSIAKQVAEALDAAHTKGIIHRDLKPGNIKVTADGRVKVLDFGLAKVASQNPTQNIPNAETPTFVSAPEVIIGTPAYMSPEQVRGENADVRSDVWAFGCVLFEMLAGERPFDGKSTADVLAAVLHREPAWSSLRGTPAPVRAVVQRCLQKEGAERFASIADVRAALGTQPRRSVRPKPIYPVVVGTLVIVLLVALGYAAMSSWWMAKPEIPWIGVLPLRSLEGESDSFANGMTEDLTTQLGQLGPDLRVKSFLTMRLYKDPQKSLPEIARELGVDYLVEGSVRRAQGKILVNASLRAADDTPLWQDIYERDDADVLSLQRELARDVAIYIRIKLTPQNETRLAEARKVIPEAYKAYRDGMDKAATRVPQGLLASLDDFEKAIKIDPGFAEPHAGLARVYANMGFSSLMLPQEAYAEARTEAQKALALDPANEDARITLTRVRVDHDWDFERAEAEYKEFIRDNPNNVPVYGYYSELLVALGRLDEALKMNRQTLEFDPRALEAVYRECWILYMSRRLNESIAGWQKILENAPSLQLAYSELGDAYALAGRNQEAFEHYQQGLSAGLVEEDILSLLERSYRSGGLNAYRGKWLELQEKDEERTGEIYTYNRAKLHARVGNRKETLFWLEEAFKERHNRLIFIKVEPVFDAVRSEPQFIDLMKRVGLVRQSRDTR